MKESTMATIKDIAAKLNEGCSYSEVSKALGISKSTVSKYANRIKQSNLTLAQASECQEQELDVNFQRFPTLDAKKLVNAPKMSAHHRGICHF